MYFFVADQHIELDQHIKSPNNSRLHKQFKQPRPVKLGDSLIVYACTNQPMGVGLLLLCTGMTAAVYHARV